MLAQDIKPQQIVAFLKSHGWKCVRAGDFIAQFEKPLFAGVARVSVPMNQGSTKYARDADVAVSIIANHTRPRRPYAVLLEEMAAL